MLHTSLSPSALATYVAHQLSTFFPDGDVDASTLASSVHAALDRLEHCVERNHQRYFQTDAGATFNHRNTDQYAMFLYLLANASYRDGAIDLASKVYGLNKALHALDVFYEVELPAVFAFQHPVGTVLGRARYSDYLYVYQRCSVGSSLDGKSPVFGEGVVLFGGSAVIGDVRLGDNVWLSVNTVVMDESIASHSVVFGASPQLIVRRTHRDVRRDMFKVT